MICAGLRTSSLVCILVLSASTIGRSQGASKHQAPDATKQLFSTVLQASLSDELVGKEFPFSGERRLSINLSLLQVEQVVYATGTVHFVEPREKLKAAISNIVPAGTQKSRFTLNLTGPVAGVVRGKFPSLGMDSQARFTADAAIELKGMVELKNKDLSILVVPNVNEFRSQIRGLAFEESWANAVVAQVAEQAVNSWLTEAKTRQQFATTVNKALKQAVKDEKLKISLGQLISP